MFKFGIARVKEAYLDHVEWAIRIRDLQSDHEVSGPAMKACRLSARILLLWVLDDTLRATTQPSRCSLRRRLGSNKNVRPAICAYAIKAVTAQKLKVRDSARIVVELACRVRSPTRKSWSKATR